MPKLHPVTLMLAYIGLALGIAWFDLTSLWLLSCLAIMMIVLTGIQNAWHMLRRARLLFLLMLLVYGFMTPGQDLMPGWEVWSPSREGIELALMHVWRLGLLLAMLAALLNALSRAQLLSGIYQLLSPLQIFGVSVQRIAVRLWLTLHYVERENTPQPLRESWRQVLALPQKSEERVVLSLPGFMRADLMFGVLYTALMGWMLW